MSSPPHPQPGPLPESEDLLLAQHLEGLLSLAEREALEARLAQEPGLAARHALLGELLGDPLALAPAVVPVGLEDRVQARLAGEGLVACAGHDDDDVLAEPIELPRLPLPVGLQEVVLARLEAEGLVEARDDAAETPLLEPAVLARLEAEGLVEPTPATRRPARRGVLLTFPRVAALAAGLLLTAGLGVALLRSQQALSQARQELAALRQDSERQLATRREELAKLRGDLSERRRRLAELETTLAGQASTLDEARRELAAARKSAASEAVARHRERQDTSQRLAQLTRQRDQAQAEARQLADQLGQERSALATAREGILELQASLTRLEQREPVVASAEPAALTVGSARGVQAWSWAKRDWVEVRPGARLEPGTLVQGLSARSQLRPQGRGYALSLGRERLLVTARGDLEPLPAVPDDGRRRRSTPTRFTLGSDTALALEVERLEQRATMGPLAGRGPALRKLGELLQAHPELVARSELAGERGAFIRVNEP